MINHDFIKEKQDLTYLEWDKARESSGTSGSFLKAYELVDGKKIYYKLSAYDQINGITGRECFNELIVSRFLDILNVRHLNYQLIHGDVLLSGKTYDTFLCASADFKEKGDRKITLEDEYALEKEDNETILSFCERMGWLSYIYQMIVIDFLIINRDRHGANIEIVDLAGEENAVIFGLKNEEVEELYRNGSYSPWDMYNSDSRIKAIMDSLFEGEWTSYRPDKFRMIFDEIMNNNDQYFILKDLPSYIEAQEKASKLYQDKDKWATMCLINIASSGFFSSDRTIESYVKDIWKLPKIA